jgi:hypothetical protein
VLKMVGKKVSEYDGGLQQPALPSATSSVSARTLKKFTWQHRSLGAARLGVGYNRASYGTVRSTMPYIREIANTCITCSNILKLALTRKSPL